ncbi:MAG: sulfatase-like hydrolase/transferase [Acidobacteria bacterium]|nr:sulfatase-like hydrolase/transferase [Acidobacteriota bacterium]
MSNKIGWSLLILYLAIVGSFCGLEIDTYIQDLPFFQIHTLLLFINVLFVLLLPILAYALLTTIQPLWANRTARIFFLLLSSIYIHFMILLAIYKSVRKTDFDFFFFWYNSADALPVLWKLFAPWMFGVTLSVAVCILLQQQAFPLITGILKNSRKLGIIFAAVIVSSMICQLATIGSIRSSAAGFVYANFISDRQLRNDYRRLYQDHIEALRSDTYADIRQGVPSILGDVIFVVKQESLNDLLVGPQITPQLLKASRDGILFRQLYANSIQSLRGYECILCGVPPNIEGALVDDYSAEEINKLSCLPRIFKALGYSTLYFFGGSHNPRIVSFAKSIGFERVLADNIVHPEDIKFDWGYREDIFYTRVHEYIQDHHANDKLFVFIDTGATNHAPFEVLDDALRDQIPFPHPDKFQERLSNTTFVQDAYFGHLYDIYRRHYAPRSSLIAVSDHAWPMPRHKHNIYNERGAYEENFLITLLFTPPSTKREDFAIGNTVTHRFSQMDILPSILDMIGLNRNRLLGESFAPWLLANQNYRRTEPQKSKLSIQPYGGGYISVVQYPRKYLFDVLSQDIKIYDLMQDPEEQNPEIRDPAEYMYLIEDFFKNRGNPSPAPESIGKDPSSR